MSEWNPGEPGIGQLPGGGYPPTQPNPQYPQPGYPPPGPPAGPPPGPPAGPSSGSHRWVYATIAVVFVLLVVAVVVLVVTRNDSASASEVFLEPTNSAGANPFTNSVAANSISTGAITTTTSTPGAASGAAITSVSGGQPGLYGGTKNEAACNAAQMVTYLEATPDKARAWASVYGIQPTQIRQFVSQLTAVVLRNDVRVTNHGYVNGQATTINSVLQAGTAVMVDQYGAPTVKCGCGNPLTAPAPVRSPRYSGPPWPGWSPSTVVVIQQTTTVINIFVLTDPNGGTFTQPAGSLDNPQSTTTSTTASTTSTTTTDTTPTTLPAVTVPPEFTVPPPTGPPTPPPTHTTTMPPPTNPPPTAPPDSVQIEDARTFFLNHLGACGMSNATNQYVIPQGSTSFQGHADFFVGGVAKSGTWNISFTNGVGSMSPANSDAQACPS